MKSGQSQLWKEEIEVLNKLASKVPENGMIVEIGTAQGGSALLFYRATKGKNISIYSCDIAPSPQAFTTLKGTGVQIVKKSSVQFAREWPNVVDRQIDFLFIDGSHTFEAVYLDFHSWVKYMKPNGLLVFHDYDPPERGGVAHFGVKIFLDALLQAHIFRNAAHKYKLLYGYVENPQSAKVTLNECYQALEKIRKNILTLRKSVFRHSYKSGLQAIKNRSSRMDSLSACYIFEYLLRKDFDLVYQNARQPEIILRWGEVLKMLEHSCGLSAFPDKHFSFSRTLREFSAAIAYEQVRLRILSQILQGFVTWHL
jgi:predicted O-methyltransferase YrrM